MKNNPIFIVVLLVLLFIGIYVFSKNINSTSENVEEQIMCATDVQMCDDGSYVNRTGLNCEFAMCPVPSSDSTVASSTKSFLDKEQGISFDYVDNFYITTNGESFLTKYIHPVEWPPQISVSTSSFSCSKKDSKNIGGKTYCLTTESEGAAGSTYTTYTYKIQINKKVIAISFVVRFAQCANYPDDKKLECEKERTTFSIDKLVDDIYKSVKFI